MPVGYLITVALAAGGTLLALAPTRRPRVLAALSFRVGLLFNELPFLVLLFLLASTALAIGDGDVESGAAWLVVGAALLVMAGQAVIVKRGLLTRPTIERALRDGLGAGWRDALDAVQAGRLRRRLPLARIALLPFPPLSRPGSVERVADIRYGDAGRENLLNLYRHRSHPQKAPVLVYVHGGGYFSGGKSREARPLIYRLASQGWVCISANYRLKPGATFPDHLIDLKKVIAWVCEHGEVYGADPATLFVAGSSAGGHLASLAALTPNDPAFQPGFEAADTSVLAGISLYGYLGSYHGMGSSSSPGEHLRPDAPPFFLAQGDRDTYSPRFVEIARGFAGELQGASSSPVVYAELPGGQHAFDLFHSIRFEMVIDGIEAFAAWVRSKGGVSGDEEESG
jgi:acetyl esterase/lipase